MEAFFTALKRGFSPPLKKGGVFKEAPYTSRREVRACLQSYCAVRLLPFDTSGQAPTVLKILMYPMYTPVFALPFPSLETAPDGACLRQSKSAPGGFVRAPCTRTARDAL
jgi:hypothetical protein